MSKKFNKQCPECKSKSVIPIKYGMPGTKMQEDATMGKIKLGGCGIKEYDMNDRYCNDCEHEWFKGTEYCTRCLDVVMYCDCYIGL
tara:strand:- start:343 stop:600 length:258 start_codon:yes stop_codon:yes gene_type:complete